MKMIWFFVGFPFIIAGYISHKVVVFIRSGWEISKRFD